MRSSPSSRPAYSAGVGVDRHRAVAPSGDATRRSRPRLRGVEVLLLVARRDARLARQDPDLQEVRGLSWRG
jgi:hypothetical protein